MFLIFKFLAVLVAISGIFGFAYNHEGGALTLPITCGIGVLIFAISCMFERLIAEIHAKNENNKKQDNPEEKK